MRIDGANRSFYTPRVNLGSDNNVGGSGSRKDKPNLDSEGLERLYETFFGPKEIKELNLKSYFDPERIDAELESLIKYL